MEKVHKLSQEAENLINNVLSPIKPALSHTGRFLLVVTFVEDALRIFMQWGDQIRFMEYYRGFPKLAAHIFLAFNVVMMLAGSVMSLARYQTPYACIALASVVVAQTIGYGLLFNITFILRNLSLLGGILLLLAEHYIAVNKKGSRTSLFPGLPHITETERGTYVSLFGRIMLILLFGALGFTGETFTLGRLLFGIMATVSCLMVAVGFKAKYSAMFLVAILCVFNVFINQWWTYNDGSPERDFLRYDFFQMLSIIGGFLLLANTGPGELSIDEKKKSF